MTRKQEYIEKIFTRLMQGERLIFWLDEIDHGRYLYYGDGILRKKCEYDEQGNLIGEYKIWDNKGQLTISQTHKNGNVVRNYDI